MTVRIVMIALLLIAMSLSARAQSRSSTEVEHLSELMTRGSQLSEAGAKELEALVATRTDDLNARIQLLAYYEANKYDKNFKRLIKEMLVAKEKHIFWIIENHPEHLVCDIFLVKIAKDYQPEAYAQARELWVKKVARHQDNAKILAHAAKFFMLDEKEIAEALLKRAQALDPNNPEWPKRLSLIYTSFSITRSPEARKESALNSLVELENALSLTTTERDRMLLLTQAPMVAFNAGEMEKARAYAITLLGEAPRYEKTGYIYGNALHQANIVLGRVALRLNDTAKAKAHLLKAGEVPGTTNLVSYGPNMSLAKDLLEIGEKEVVIKYFQLCAKFWEMGREQLQVWEYDVRANRLPQFGANLDY